MCCFMSKEEKNQQITSYRWIVLGMFIIIALMSQLLWLTFAPLTSEISQLYQVTAFDISLLSLVWPLVFVITAIPVGIYIDKKGFKKSVSIGAIFLAAFSITRIFSVTFDHNFLLLLISQTGAAVSQPFIFGSITKLASSWFPEKEQGLATGLGTIGLFLGMMLALALTPPLYLSFGLTKLLFIYAYLTCAAAFLFIVLAKEGTLVSTMDTSASFTLKDMWTLSKHRSFLILEFGFFVAVGGFTALMTWLEQMLHSLHGIGIDEAGLLGGIMIIGGIIGSIVIPALSDKLKRLKPFIILDLLIGVVTLYLIGVISGFMLLAAIFFVMGFFLMSALPLVLELSTQFSDPGMEGRASSLLWFFSQAGSVFLIIIIEPIYALWGSYLYSIYIIVGLWIISVLSFITIKER